MKTLTVICPVHNQQDVIGIFYAGLRSELSRIAHRYSTTILFVLDRSTDGSRDILSDIAQKDRHVQVLVLSSQFGLHMATLAGIDHAHSDAIILMDSDLTHPPGLIPELLGAFEAGHDIVSTVTQDPPHISPFTRLNSKLFYRLINRLSTVPIDERAADFRLISHKVAIVFQTQLRERNLFLRGLFSWVGFNTTTIPLPAGPRSTASRNDSLRRRLRFGINAIISFSKRPLQGAIALGFLFATFGLAFAAVTFAQYLYYDSLPSGWTTLVILISLFSGVQLICLGIIGEYIGAIFDEVKGRPHYIVDERIHVDDA